MPRTPPRVARAYEGSPGDLRYNIPASYGPTINSMMLVAHTDQVVAGWWHDIHTGEPLERNVGEMMALIHSEISEALEAHRKGLMDDKLPYRPGVEVELADAMIRILDLAGGLGLDLGGAFVDKMKFNRERADHKPENRALEGGKAF